MHKPHRKKILAVMTDLFFTVKLNEAAKRTGLDVEFVKSNEDAMERARGKPLLIIVDLNCHSIDALKLVSDLKGDPELKGISIISYLSHVQGELKQQAHDAGADMVLARSAFSQNLPQILKRHQGVF